MPTEPDRFLRLLREVKNQPRTATLAKADWLWMLDEIHRLREVLNWVQDRVYKELNRE